MYWCNKNSIRTTTGSYSCQLENIRRGVGRRADATSSEVVCFIHAVLRTHVCFIACLNVLLLNAARRLTKLLDGIGRTQGISKSPSPQLNF